MNPTPPGREQDSKQLQPNSLQLPEAETGAKQRTPAVTDLQFYFQPIFGITRRPLMYEALVRWQDSTGAVHAPAAFLDGLLATENSATVFTSHTIEAAATVLSNYAELPAVSINLSPAQICRNETLAHLESLPYVLRRRLIIEVTEEVITEREPYCLWLGETAALGIDLILDDLMPADLDNRLLPHLPVAGVKLDRSLLPTLLAPEPDRALLQTVRDLRRLKLSVAVEGIEDGSVFTRLVKLGFDRFQGYGLGAPLPLCRPADLVTGTTALMAGSPAGF